MITQFTPLASTIGGVLIGVAAVMLMAFSGRIAGISGILGRLFHPYADADSRGEAFFVRRRRPARRSFLRARGII